jgi:hypothetical protein
LASLENWHCGAQQFIDYRRKLGSSNGNGSDLGMTFSIPDLFMKQFGQNVDSSVFHRKDLGKLSELYVAHFENSYTDLEQKAFGGKIESETISAFDF